MPVWPFLFTFLIAFAAFGWCSELQGKLGARVRFATIAVASIAAIATGLLLVIHEPWGDETIDASGASLNARKGIVVAILNLALAIGPQLTGIVFLAIGFYLLKDIPLFWREAWRSQ